MLAATAAARPDAPAVRSHRDADLWPAHRGGRPRIGPDVDSGWAAVIASPSGCPSETRRSSRSTGRCAAGGIAVPVNALLKPPQVAHILRDSGAKVLVTTAARLADLVREVPERLGSLCCSGHGRQPGHAGPQHWPCSAGRNCSAQPPQAHANDHRHRRGGVLLHLRQHRQAQGRGAVTPQHGGGRAQCLGLPRQHARRPPAGGAQLQLRLRLQPAHDRLRRGRERRAARLCAAAGSAADTRTRAG